MADVSIAQPLFVVEITPNIGSIATAMLAAQGNNVEGDAKSKTRQVDTAFGGITTAFYTFTKISEPRKTFRYFTPPSNKGYSTPLIDGVEYSPITMIKGITNSIDEINYLDFWSNLQERVALMSMPSYIAQAMVRIYVCKAVPEGAAFRLISTQVHEMRGCYLDEFSYPPFDANSLVTFPVKSLIIKPSSIDTRYTYGAPRDFGVMKSSVLDVLDYEINP